MIKVAIFNLNKNCFIAFTMNQEWPLGTFINGTHNMSRSEAERLIISRFQSQRNRWKQLGKTVPSLPKKNAWKFAWWTPSILWGNQPKLNIPEEIVRTTELELVNEPGLTITKRVPVVETPKLEQERLFMAEVSAMGKLCFTPLPEDVVTESQIPEYIRTHTKRD